MARALRIEYEGALYHVLSLGDRRETIFLVSIVSSPYGSLTPYGSPSLRVNSIFHQSA